MLNRVTAASAY